MPGVQGQAPSVVEHTAAGLGVIAKGLRNPLVARHIQHQATTAVGAAAGMMKTGRHDYETLLHHLTATTVDLEIQRTRQPEHQLRVVMAVDDQVVGVLA
ncbi:hypothetical protein D3C84_1096780 [compost metagenome]